MINVRLKQSNHRHNYNLMGFETIEINLVFKVFSNWERHEIYLEYIKDKSEL